MEKKPQLNQQASQAIEAMLKQLLIVLVNRMGGEIKIPASEIDNTGDFYLTLESDPDSKEFTFKVFKKDQLDRT